MTSVRRMPSPVDLRRRTLAHRQAWTASAEHGDLVPEHQDLHVPWLYQIEVAVPASSAPGRASDRRVVRPQLAIMLGGLPTMTRGRPTVKALIRGRDTVLGAHNFRYVCKPPLRAGAAPPGRSAFAAPLPVGARRGVQYMGTARSRAVASPTSVHGTNVASNWTSPARQSGPKTTSRRPSPAAYPGGADAGEIARVGGTRTSDNHGRDGGGAARIMGKHRVGTRGGPNE